MVPHDASLHRPGAETSVFVIGDRARRFQPFEFLELIGHTEANDLAQIVASLLDPLVLPLRHPAALRDQVDEHKTIGEPNAWLRIDLAWMSETDEPAVGRFVAFMRDEARSRKLL